MDLVSAYTLNSMFWGMYITLELITKQIIYCVKGDIFKMLTIYTNYTSWPEKTVATHSSTLAWKMPWTEEPGRLQSVGLPRVGHD